MARRAFAAEFKREALKVMPLPVTTDVMRYNESVEKVQKRPISIHRGNARLFVGHFEHCRCQA